MSRGLPWILGLALLVTGVLYGREITNRGALNQQLHQQEQALDSIRRLRRGVDTLFVHQVDTLRIRRVVTDSILARDTLTFIRVDTVKQIVQAERRACDAVIGTCEKQKRLLGAEITNLTEQLRLERKKKPSRFGCAGPASVNTKGVGLGVGCGLKF